MNEQTMKEQTMNVTATLDLDVIEQHRPADLACLVSLTAPARNASIERPGQAIIVVLDRSGSMRGEPLQACKHAIIALTRRLAPQDTIGIVTFDDHGTVRVPATRVRDVNLRNLHQTIRGITAGNTTDLSAGYLLGLREARRAAASPGTISTTVLVISDGHVNAGISNPDELASIARHGQATDRVTTSTVGFGVRYDEVLLEALTRGGNGTHRFAPDVDAATHEISDLVGDLLSQAIAGAVLRITPARGVSVTLMQDLPNWREGRSTIVNLGDLYSGEERKTLLTFRARASERLGPAGLASLELECTTLPDVARQAITLQLDVTIATTAAARLQARNPVVELECLLARIDEDKRLLAGNLRAGERQHARQMLGSALSSVNEKRQELHATGASRQLTERLDRAAAELLALSDDVLHRDADYASKAVTGSFSATSRGRTSKPRPASPTHRNHPAHPARPQTGART